MTYIKTTYHPSGRYSCLERKAGDRMWKSLGGKLLGNFNKTEFYEEVRQLVIKLRSSGDLASYDDQASRVD